MRKKVTKAQPPKPQSFDLATINPKTKNQELIFNAFDDEKNLLIYGCPGTGKSFCAMYLALESLFEEKKQSKIIIVRSVVPGRDIGFLPGTIKEKIAVYEEPYKSICTELLQRGDAYDILKLKNMVEFTTTSFLRSMTWKDSIIIFDEFQSAIDTECFTVMTRVGENCRVIVCGDKIQSDLKKHEESGFDKLKGTLERMPSFATIELGVKDIVRSGFSKEFIIARNEYELGSIDTLPKEGHVILAKYAPTNWKYYITSTYLESTDTERQREIKIKYTRAWAPAPKEPLEE